MSEHVREKAEDESERVEVFMETVRRALENLFAEHNPPEPDCYGTNDEGYLYRLPGYEVRPERVDQ